MEMNKRETMWSTDSKKDERVQGHGARVMDVEKYRYLCMCVVRASDNWYNCISTNTGPNGILKGAGGSIR